MSSRSIVPCGHPNRYETNNVVRVSPNVRYSDTGRGKILNRPPQNIETEGERQIKHLAKKQIDTNLTMREHMSRHRIFTEKVLYKPKTAELKGINTLDTYNKIRRQDEELEFLRQCGLSEDEIKLKRVHDITAVEIQSEKRSRYGMNPLVQKEIIQNIEHKINAKKSQFQSPYLFSGARCISRHEMELENALNSHRNEARFQNCLITIKQADADTCPGDPINQLNDISDSLIRREHKMSLTKEENLLHETEANTKELKCKEMNSSEGTDPCEKDFIKSCNFDKNISNISVIMNKESSIEKKLNGNHEIDKVPKVTPIRQLLHKVEPISKEDISKCCISLEEICQLSRFKEYTPGNKSKVLYLKNLSKKVTESDLVKLFIHFQTDEFPLKFNLLTGKMRGQAFLTFDSANTAESALKLVNGYMLKGQPVIIQYGKKLS